MCAASARSACCGGAWGTRLSRPGKRRFWGGLWGLLFGSAFFLVPGIGPLLAAGPLVGWIIGALEGAVVVGGLSALGTGLYSIGIPKDSIIEYETQIKAGKFVVIVHGSPDEVRKTKGTLAVTKHQGQKDGMTGMTAWTGLNLVEVKASDVVFISGAAGAVGNVAG